MYTFIRSLLFRFDAEKVHYFSMNAFVFFSRIPLLNTFLRRYFRPGKSTGKVQVAGLEFRNPLGLAAGFDKNARYLRQLEMLGFGFVEIGTVTPLPQAGNEKPRLFRLPEDKAIINRMGFNNDGVEEVAKRLRKFKKLAPKNFIIGGNIGKNKITANNDAWKDYEICFRELHDTVDYFVVNVSSPNTPGLRDLQQTDSLRKILTALQTINESMLQRKPIFLKISPDLPEKELNDIIDLAIEIKLDGLVATNTTLRRDNLRSANASQGGGLSGKPLQEISAEITSHIHDRTNGSLPIISSGGIFTGSEASARMQKGASLVQIWTSFIFEGPGVVKKICRQLR